MTRPKSNAERLTEAFHLLFDVKDSLPSGSPGHYAVYEAIGKVGEAMRELAVEEPRRFDNKEGTS